MKKIVAFLKKEMVLSIASALAILSMFFVPPSVTYLSYLDFRVLALLFALMLVVAGFKSIGVFQYLGVKILSGTKSTRQLALLLIALCFFSSMFITNDVALITFVPFAILILTMASKEELLIPVIVLQTIAANLGSMFTPLGNPQNLYLYSTFEIPIGKFLLVMAPLTVLSALLLVFAIFRLPESDLSLDSATREEDSLSAKAPDKKLFIAYLFLFIICLLCVVRILPYQAMLVILILACLLLDRRLFKQVDYFLLLTFVAFFLFIGNMERIPAISEFFHRILIGRELFLGALLSQVISNVPAAILLSGFTDNGIALLYGVNIGGLGTLIASLASVISYRAYTNAKGSKGYLACFTKYNLIFLLLLLLAGFAALKILG